MFKVLFNIPVDSYVHIISRVIVRCVQCLLFVSLATKTLNPRDFKNYKFYKIISTVGLIILTVAVYLFGSQYFSYSYINFIFVFLCMIFSSMFFRNNIIQNQIIIFIYFIAFSAVSYITYNSYNILGVAYGLSGVLNNIIPATGSIFLAYIISSFLLPKLICFNNNKFNTDIILFILSFVGFLCLSFRSVNNNLLISAFMCLVLTLVMSGLRTRKIKTTQKLIKN
ncbi:MAG: hypothetical protein J6C55_03645 [Oscillospiraceae bacterium]|nr:hypothetical protein [Oscillospiraceae bacterium]